MRPDERILADTDTLLVFGLDHLLSEQAAEREELEVLEEWLKREGTCLMIGGPGNFTMPRKPVRKRFRGIPQFVVTRGGEYCFMPGLRALRWLADLET